VHTILDPSVAWALGAFGAPSILFIAALAYPPGLGMGDVKLALLLGAMLGAAVSVALLVGFLASLVPALVLFARYRGAARKLAVPLVPFLSLGAVVALFWGDDLVQAYLARL
jgi:leader peptidase (prepilin peptidase)/N-methyltransferase